MNKTFLTISFLVIVILTSCTATSQNDTHLALDRPPVGVSKKVANNPIIQTQEAGTDVFTPQTPVEVLYFPNGRKSNLQEVMSISPWDITLPQSTDELGDLSLEWVELRDGGKQFGWWGTALHYSRDIVIAYRYPPIEAFISDEVELDEIWQELRTNGFDKLSPKFQEAIKRAGEEQNEFLRHVQADGSGLTSAQEICGHTVYVRDYHPEHIVIEKKTIDDGSSMAGSTVSTSTWSDHAEVIWVDSRGGSYHILDVTPIEGEEVMGFLLDVTRSIMKADKASCNP